LKELGFVIHFELPETYKKYKENGAQVQLEEGAMISLVTPKEEKENGMLSTY